MYTILFVDDEPNILNGIKRMLRSMRSEWDMLFATSAMEAIGILDEKKIDVIVTDIRMPQMDGIQLLEHVAKHHPRVIRFILSGQAEKEAILRSIGPMHQYLTKPTNGDMIQSAIQRSIALRSILHDEKLLDIVSNIDTLPSLPKLYYDLVKHLEKDEPSIGTIGKIISQDPGMTAKILHLVNSSYYSLSQRVTDINQAIALLGIDSIRILVISAHAFSTINPDILNALPLSYLWGHSANTANIARIIARDQGLDSKQEQYSYMGALLHDIGVLILVDSFTEKYKIINEESQKTETPFDIVERYVFGVTHAEIGAYLLGIWGLPDWIVETACYHHEPNNHPGDTFNHVTTVYLANIIDHIVNERDAFVISTKFDEELLEKHGIHKQVNDWINKAREMKEKNNHE